MNQHVRKQEMALPVLPTRTSATPVKGTSECHDSYHEFCLFWEKSSKHYCIIGIWHSRKKIPVILLVTPKKNVYNGMRCAMCSPLNIVYYVMQFTVEFRICCIIRTIRKCYGNCLASCLKITVMFDN